uniref:LRRCT domain-containing protein n=1 Tax=Leptobrachium leishanense TaxID=445787 RepID=A0A8C5WDF4_9ANUR
MGLPNLLSSFSSHYSLRVCPSHCLCDSISFFVNCSGTNLSYSLVRPPLNTEYMDLSSCSLHYIPSLHSLWRLHTLLLAQNNIWEVEQGTWSGLHSLQSLDLNRNIIRELNVSFSLGLDSLTHLFIAHNQLHTLQGLSFQHLQSLELLDLQGNVISTIQPGSLRPLTQLRRLRLQNNFLQSLRNNDFSVLQKLEYLDLSGNQIHDLPPWVFAPLYSLTFLNLQHNMLHHLRFQTLLSLPAPGSIILLSHNPWECDCDLQRVFGKLGGVQRLSLQDREELLCAEPPALRGRHLMSLDTRLCVAETVTVLIITLTVVVTVVGAIVMAERSRKKRPRSHQSEMFIQD